MGFLDDLGNSLSFQAMIEASKDKSGKPDPWKVAGMAAGMGLDPSQLAGLGAMLGAQGVFDKNNDPDDEPDDEEPSFLNGIYDPVLRAQAKKLLDFGLDPFDLETQDGEDLWETVRDMGLDPNDYRLEDLAAEAGNYTTVPNWDPHEDDRLHSFTDEDLLEEARTLIRAGLDLDDLETLDGPELFIKVCDLGLDPNDYRMEDLAAEVGNFITVPDWDPNEDDRLHNFSDENLLEEARRLIRAGLDLDDLEALDGPELFIKVHRLGLDPDDFDLEGLAEELGNYIEIPD